MHKQIFLSLLAILLVFGLAASPSTALAKNLASQSTGAEMSQPNLQADGNLPPGLPSSFYGTVKRVNGENVPDGTQVIAKINGVTVATAVTQTYSGSSVYVIDVKAGTTGASPIDGGAEGDVVQFVVGGDLMIEKGAWHGGTLANLNLTESRKVYLPVLIR